MIREATPADRPALARMMAALNAVEAAISPDRDLSLEAASAHLAYLEATASANGGFVLVSSADDLVNGFLVAHVEKEDGEYVLPAMRQYGFICDLFVESKARRQGLAQHLVSEAGSRFRAAGLSSMRVSALAANQAACAFYQSEGFLPFDIVFRKELPEHE